jgi:hypothetical protein
VTAPVDAVEGDAGVSKRLNRALQSGHSTGAFARGVHSYPHDGHFFVFVIFT